MPAKASNLSRLLACVFVKNCYGIIFFLVITVACNKHISSPNPAVDPWQKLNAPAFGEPLDMKFTSADTGYILGAKYSYDSIL